MRTGTTSLLAFWIALVACRDGSEFAVGDDGGSMSNIASSGVSVGTSGSATGSSGGGGSGTSSAATSGSSGSSGSSGTSSGSTSGNGGGSGSLGGTDASTEAGSGGVADPYSGPFKVLVLSKTLGFHHDSIPWGQQMLRDLGKCIDAASCALTNDVPIAGAKANSSFTVDVAGAPANCPAVTSSNVATYVANGCDGRGTTSDLSQFTTANLKNYQMVFFVSPTGEVFSKGGANGTVGMAAIQAFIEGGGAYGGVHAASDFEKNLGWPWYYNTLLGAFFTLHNNDGTPGSVITAPMYASHPVMRGLPSPLSTQDEWYFMNRQISAQPGFQILATLSGVPPVSGESPSDIRPIVWIRQFPVATDPTLEGRMFYTCRGHNITRFREPDFRQLVHQGVLWATHRLN
jgi:type 1 glutamine amidotransferase